MIQNLLGQTLKSFDKISSANQLDLSDLGDGIYLIRFVTEYGDLTDKVIIQ